MATAESVEKVGLRFSEAELQLLRQKYEKLTDIEFDAFLSAAQRYRLNPLANQFYARLQPATPKNPRAVTYMAQIDGFRLIAERTGDYAGNDDPVYDNERDKHPAKATVIVHKLVADQRVPFSASARWAEYCPGGNAAFMWDRMPYLMLGKCAEALALRKAFPTELSGLYTVEEMHQADEGDEPPKKQESASSAPAPESSKPKAAPAPSNEKRKLDIRNMDTERVLKLIAAAEKYEQLAMVLEGVQGGPTWAEPGSREWVMKGLGARYRELIEKKLPDVPAVTKPFVAAMKAHRETLDAELDALKSSKEGLDDEFEKLQQKLEAEVAAEQTTT